MNIKPSHKFNVWQAAKWAAENEIRNIYAVTATCWTGGEFGDLSGKVFCLGSHEKCQAFLDRHAADNRGLDLQMWDLEEVYEGMEQDEAERHWESYETGLIEARS